MRILHFSDPHVQLPRWRERPLRELGPLRALATVELWKGRGRDYEAALAVLGQIVRDADALRADLVVCTGDLTQLAMEEEFALARAALAPLGERLVCIHGNHDRYPLGGAPNRLYEAYFETWYGKPGFGGFLIWAWTPGHSGPDDRGYTPEGKPAEEVLRKWLAKGPWKVE